MLTTRSPAARRPLHFANLIAVFAAAAIISMLLYEVVVAWASPQPGAEFRETGCWSDPMSDIAPLACGEHAARIRAERGVVEAR